MKAKGRHRKPKDKGTHHWSGVGFLPGYMGPVVGNPDDDHDGDDHDTAPMTLNPTQFAGTDSGAAASA